MYYAKDAQQMKFMRRTRKMLPVDSNGCSLGEWTYIDEYFSQEDARKLKELLIDLSDRELRGEF